MPVTLLVLAALSAPIYAAPPAPKCSPGNAGLKLPAGFCAVLVASKLGPVRHIAVAPNGDVLAANMKTGVILLRDSNGDGMAEEEHQIFVGAGGTGLALGADVLYFAANDSVMLIPFTAGSTQATGTVRTLARGLPGGGHFMKGLALAKDGSLFVSFGSLTNSCQKLAQDRTGAFPGQDPCPELPIRSGIWRFSTKTEGQTPADAKHFGWGLRNPEAMAIEPSTGTLYMASHGRDQLTENWKWPAEEGRENPAEEFGPVVSGANYGWPYCFYNPRLKKKLQNPEYGGDGTKVGDCDKKTQPAIAFPAHWAPNALMFYSGSMFGDSYKGGAFLAFHGSWNRAPAPQEGYRVVFIPFKDGKPVGTWMDFAVAEGATTDLRPTGLAQGPDGSLYVSDDAHGRIWRIVRQ